MKKIKVRAKIGNTIHPKYGPLEEGQILEIDGDDFGEEIFELLTPLKELNQRNKTNKINKRKNGKEE